MAPGFALEEMIERGDAFIDYAYDVGATVAGATDTQGEAPKIWVAQDAEGRWHPDNGQLGAQARRYALLKFPVPEAGARAVDILRHEAVYQKVARVMGCASLPSYLCLSTVHCLSRDSTAERVGTARFDWEWRACIPSRESSTRRAMRCAIIRCSLSCISAAPISMWKCWNISGATY
jgi:hypothetical protein